MDKNLLIYYTIKRLFICIDEWLFYYILYILYINKYYKVLPFVIIFGFSCIYTSYSNIDKIEKNIIDVKQNVFLNIKNQ